MQTSGLLKTRVNGIADGMEIPAAKQNKTKP